MTDAADFDSNFIKALKVKNTGIYYLSYGLFWMRPDKFLPIKKETTLAYLERCGILSGIVDLYNKEYAKQTPNFENVLSEYKRLMDAVNEKIAKKELPGVRDFASLSSVAWRESKIGRKMNYWHMQLHPNDRDAFPKEKIEKILCEKKVIGLGDYWEDINGNPAADPNAFEKEMDKNDIVMIRDTKNPIAIVEVTGDCFKPTTKDDDFDWFPLRRNVEILEFFNLEAEKLLNKILKEKNTEHIQAMGTLTKCSNDDNATNKFVKEWHKMYQKRLQLDNWTRILEMKKNIILQGAPGTGKTYNTAAIALKICGVNEGDDITVKNDDGTEKKEQFKFSNHKHVMQKYDELHYDPKENPSGQIGFVTFHQSMDYEDFVEGIKPEIAEDGTVTYDVKPGIFKKMCEKAANDDNVTHVLIIDEINRGNVSKIFGELITLLESDKRIDGDHPLYVKLPYSHEEGDFGVPSNLYIIGTMNTTDRSVGNIDYAVRRRFAFVTLEADENVLREKYGEQSKNVQLFRAVKDFLDNKDNKSELDISDLMVGHSYFLAKDEKDKDGKVIQSADDVLKMKWQYEIVPLLKEYYKDGITQKDVDKSISIDDFIKAQSEKQKEKAFNSDELGENTTENDASDND